MTDLRAAAELVLNNTFDLTDAENLARHILATNHADDGEAITAVWLESQGFEKFGGCYALRLIESGGSVFVTLPRGAMTAPLIEWRGEPVISITTRGQLRRLVAALRGEG